MFGSSEVEGQSSVFEQFKRPFDFGGEIVLAFAVGQSQYAETQLGVPMAYIVARAMPRVAPVNDQLLANARLPRANRTQRQETRKTINAELVNVSQNIFLSVLNDFVLLDVPPRLEVLYLHIDTEDFMSPNSLVCHLQYAMNYSGRTR